MQTIYESLKGGLKPFSDLVLSLGKKREAAQESLFEKISSFMLDKDSGRNLLLKVIEKNVEKLFREANESGIGYIADVKTQYAVSLARRIKHNLDRGIISKTYMKSIMKTLYYGLFYNNKESLDYKKTYGTLPPAFVTISPTHRCNLNCDGCYAASTDKTVSSLPYKVVDRLVNEMHDLMGSRFIVFSGGEPFFWKDEGKGIIDIAESHPDMFFMVYTNGLLLNEETIKRLTTTANLSPSISIEGYGDLTDARRGAGTYAKIMQTTELMKKYGFPFGLSVTASKKNIELLLEDSFYEHFYETVGATYMWMFQYMPIGRAKDTIDLMLTPEQRVNLLKKWEHLLFDKSYFVADFWNSGAGSDGCIAYGRRGGYFHVNWKGNISPCVFMPYWKDNIYDLYRDGKTIKDALFSDYFVRGREWQKTKNIFTPQADNHFAPCSIRDHHAQFRKDILAADIKPDDANAGAALQDPEYYEKLTRYGTEIGRLTFPLWQKRVGPQAGLRSVADTGTQPVAVAATEASGS